ncbi:hypothetical protein LLE49_13870 [Alicyclobacillus tolerans]|uniref:hypothetical protein n=1 Tax=Alicyclobacillus tolerans TaxID=90970 RepID=UPI001F41D77A|nr:hypothetical protein [Alicyclobacillus tolerans]MCF8565807.1 hypothetical protein [Alicyclobacillus tolerans]
MADFRIGQRIMVGPDADTAAGCFGWVVLVRETSCDVQIEDECGGYMRTFLKTDLLPVATLPAEP